MFGALEAVWRDIGIRKVGYRISAGLEEQEYVLALSAIQAPPKRTRIRRRDVCMANS